jgi:hypothetical protein
MSLWRRIYSERRRVVLPLLLAIVANAAVFALAVLPLDTVVRNSRSDAVSATAALAAARRAEKLAGYARTGKERADQELHTFYTDVLPVDQATARKTVTHWMEQAALDAGLTFKGSQFDYAEVRDSKLSRAYSKVTLQGRYPNIRKFLYALENAKEFIIVERVEVAQASDQPSATSPLELALVLSTYFVTPAHP